MAGSGNTWDPVFEPLAAYCTVVAPDLLGHGESDKPRGDYSLAAHANLVRDLLLALGHERATIVGQSFGGGVAMQLAYQYPEQCERLGLVSSGGLGQEVALLLRGLTLPGAEHLLPIACNTSVRDVGAHGDGLAGPGRAAPGARGGRDVAQLRVTERRPDARGVRAHAPVRRRPPRPAGRARRTACTWPPPSRPSSCGATVTRSSRSRTASPRTRRSSGAGSRSSRASATTRTASDRPGSLEVLIDFLGTTPATLSKVDLTDRL